MKDLERESCAVRCSQFNLTSHINTDHTGDMDRSLLQALLLSIALSSGGQRTLSRTPSVASALAMVTSSLCWLAASIILRDRTITMRGGTSAGKSISMIGTAARRKPVRILSLWSRPFCRRRLRSPSERFGISPS